MYIIIIAIIAFLCALRYNIASDRGKSIFNKWRYADDLRILATLLIPIVMCLGFALCTYPAVRFKHYPVGYQFLLSCFAFYIVFFLFTDKLLIRKNKSDETKGIIQKN